MRIAKSGEVKFENQVGTIDLGHGHDLNAIANKFPQVFDNKRIPTMKGEPYHFTRSTKSDGRTLKTRQLTFDLASAEIVDRSSKAPSV